MLFLIYIAIYYCLCSIFSSLWSEKHFITVISKTSPLIIKLGQIMSVRPDIVSTNLALILSKLRDTVTPVFINVMDAIPNNHHIISIDIIPIACGSIAQVYKGVIKVDDMLVDVVFKIIKPSVANRIVTDLNILQIFATILNRVVPSWKPVAVLKRLSTIIIIQTDFISERVNMELYRDRSYNIPVVYPELSNKNVLCMQYIQNDKINKEEKCKLFVELCKMMLESPCMLHLDLHPGNILFSKGKAYIIDLGLSQVVDTELYTLLISTIFSIMNRDSDIFAKLFAGNELASDNWLLFIREAFTRSFRYSVNCTTKNVIDIFTIVLKGCSKYNISLDDRMSSIVTFFIIANGHYNELTDRDFLQDIMS